MNGYYKFQDNTLRYGKNIYAPNFTMLEADKDNYIYPNNQDGWSWFESEDEARTAYGLDTPQPPAGYNPAQFLQQMFQSSTFEVWLNNFSNFKQAGFLDAATNAKVDGNWEVVQGLYDQFKMATSPSIEAIAEWQAVANTNNISLTF